MKTDKDFIYHYIKEALEKRDVLLSEMEKIIIEAEKHTDYENR